MPLEPGAMGVFSVIDVTNFLYVPSVTQESMPSTPTLFAISRIWSSVRPVEFSAGWFLNTACMNGTAASGSASATQYIAFAARVENAVPCE